MNVFNAILFRSRIFFIKLLHWEYWSSAVLYFPVLPYLIFLWVKTKSFFFFNAANPGIKNGGFLMESKWAIDKDAVAGFFPDTLLIDPSEEFIKVYSRILSLLSFPFIAKPDIGSKGQGVAIIHNTEELEQYHRACPFDYIVQEKINYPLEAGIFYVRLPGQNKGQITGIVQKEFVQVTGNGKESVYQLLMQNPRYVLQIKSLQKIIVPETMQVILPGGKTKLLVDIGNHARGSYFINACHRINPALTTAIDKCCQRFPGFYFGRLDIRFHSWEQLDKGEQFAVIELNGSGSEPTHIYDPANSIWYVWKEICRHWKYMANISMHNHKNGVPYLSFNEGVAMFKENYAYGKKMKLFNFAPSFKKVDAQQPDADQKELELAIKLQMAEAGIVL